MNESTVQSHNFTFVIAPCVTSSSCMRAKECLKTARSHPYMTRIALWVITHFSICHLQVLVNITLTYDMRQNSIYELCKGLIQFHFENTDFPVTGPFRDQLFIPNGCPKILNSDAAILVLEEYYCPSGKQIMFQPAGYPSPIDVCGKMSVLPSRFILIF